MASGLMLADANGYDVAMAFIGLCSAVLVVWLPIWLTSRRAKARQEAIVEAVGTPNGNGNLVQMHERMLSYQLESLAWQQRHDAADDKRFLAVTERLDKLEHPGG